MTLVRVKYIELHITYLNGESEEVPQVSGWKHTAIDGDFNLGNGVKHYLTRQAHRRHGIVGLVRDMEQVADELERSGKKVLRTKVEEVLYDRRRFL
jgi:hypothetical protein